MLTIAEHNYTVQL